MFSTPYDFAARPNDPCSALRQNYRIVDLASCTTDARPTVDGRNSPTNVLNDRRQSVKLAFLDRNSQGNTRPRPLAGVPIPAPTGHPAPENPPAALAGKRTG